jgi:hypothetical protein
MMFYTVLDSRADPAGCWIYLQDSSGARHLARVTAEAPQSGAELHGGLPILGLAALASRSGQVYQINFETVNCSQVKALNCLHGEIGC